MHAGTTGTRVNHGEAGHSARNRFILLVQNLRDRLWNVHLNGHQDARFSEALSADLVVDVPDVGVSVTAVASLTKVITPRGICP